MQRRAKARFSNLTHSILLFIEDLICASIRTLGICLVNVINKTQLQKQDGVRVTAWCICPQKRTKE